MCPPWGPCHLPSQVAAGPWRGDVTEPSVWGISRTERNRKKNLAAFLLASVHFPLLMSVSLFMAPCSSPKPQQTSLGSSSNRNKAGLRLPPLRSSKPAPEPARPVCGRGGSDRKSRNKPKGSPEWPSCGGLRDIPSPPCARPGKHFGGRKTRAAQTPARCPHPVLWQRPTAPRAWALPRNILGSGCDAASPNLPSPNFLSPKFPVQQALQCREEPGGSSQGPGVAPSPRSQLGSLLGTILPPWICAARL